MTPTLHTLNETPRAYKVNDYVYRKMPLKVFYKCEFYPINPLSLPAQIKPVGNHNRRMKHF